MPILSAADKPTYFASVNQSGVELDGLIAVVQALCESSYGANRLLELQPYTEVISINQTYRVGTLSLYPIAAEPLPLVEALITASVNRFAFGRPSLGAWAELAVGEYRLDTDTGDLWIDRAASQAKVSYSAGFDFSSTSPEVSKIKAIAGQVLTYFANYKVGLDSYLDHPTAANATIQSYNLVRPDQFLTAMLLPLRKYLPRRSSG